MYCVKKCYFFNDGRPNQTWFLGRCETYGKTMDKINPWFTKYNAEKFITHELELNELHDSIFDYNVKIDYYVVEWDGNT